jgi:hypothetical protein
MDDPKIPLFSALSAYSIRLRKGLFRCWRFEERVRQEIRSSGFRDLYGSAGQKAAAKKNGIEANPCAAETFAVARTGKITHNASIETIEYD